MSYTPTTDFLALLRNTSGGVRTLDMPGLDFVVSALARAGLINLSVGQTAPTTNQANTVWFQPSLPSWVGEGTVWLWSASLGSYQLASPALWGAFFRAQSGSSAFIRKPVSAATVAILASDVEVGIDTRSTAVTVTLPSAAVWGFTAPFGAELVINDYYGNAAANNITPSLFAGDSFAYGGVVPVVTEKFGILRLRPDPSLPGWTVRGVN